MLNRNMLNRNMYMSNKKKREILDKLGIFNRATQNALIRGGDYIYDFESEEEFIKGVIEKRYLEFRNIGKTRFAYIVECCRKAGYDV